MVKRPRRVRRVKEGEVGSGDGVEAERRRREWRRAALVFVLSVLRAMVEEDDAEMLVHHVRMVKGWRGGEGEEEEGLTEGEVEGFVSAAKRRINRLAGKPSDEGGEGRGTGKTQVILVESQ